MLLAETKRQHLSVRLAVHTHIWIVTNQQVIDSTGLSLAVHTHIWIVTTIDDSIGGISILAVHTHIWIVTKIGDKFVVVGTCSSYPHMDCYPSFQQMLSDSVTCSSYPHMDCYPKWGRKQCGWQTLQFIPTYGLLPAGVNKNLAEIYLAVHTHIWIVTAISCVQQASSTPYLEQSKKRI